MPSNRMHRGLVALSASAIAAVYMAGYLRTQSADASIGAAAASTLSPGVTAATAIVTNPPASATSTAIPQLPPAVQRQVPVAPRGAPAAQPTPAPVQRAAPQPTPP